MNGTGKGGFERRPFDFSSAVALGPASDRSKGSVHGGSVASGTLRKMAGEFYILLAGLETFQSLHCVQFKILFNLNQIIICA